MNNVHPLVSIITATYRNFNHLFQTISSVLSQTYEQIEYIITDDCSDNFPEREINDFISLHSKNGFEYRIIRQVQNVGTVKNLNSAYKAAKGIYIMNLSCGDIFFEKQTISKIVNRIVDRNANLVLTSRILYDYDFHPLCLTPHLEEQSKLQALSSNKEQYRQFIMTRLCGMASGSVMCVSKAIIEEFNYFDESYTYLEDCPFFAKYLWKYPIECAPDIISIWYEYGGVSTSENKGEYAPRYRNDIIRFNRTDRSDHLDCFSLLDRTLLYIDRIRIIAGGFIRNSKWLGFVVQINNHVKRTRNKNKPTDYELKFIESLINNRDLDFNRFYED